MSSPPLFYHKSPREVGFILTSSVHWYFTLKHNRETFRNISKCFLPTWHEDYTRCIEKPLIISGWWYTAETITGATTGGQSGPRRVLMYDVSADRSEVIWQSAVVSEVGFSRLVTQLIESGQTNGETRNELCSRGTLRELGPSSRNDA
jgi:hypothetical protein